MHMVRRGGTINPTITRNYFFCYKIQFHLSTVVAETHSANQNSEGPGKPPGGKNLDQKHVGDVCSVQLEGWAGEAFRGNSSVMTGACQREEL